ncbi:hypothetical protein FB451DRAFT_1191830 [Mycena latifolia]|nr:hypothetical protein FB451DRAFT_1191830 [Mycena latifolia]
MDPEKTRHSSQSVIRLSQRTELTAFISLAEGEIGLRGAGKLVPAHSMRNFSQGRAGGSTPPEALSARRWPFVGCSGYWEEPHEKFSALAYPQSYRIRETITPHGPKLDTSSKLKRGFRGGLEAPAVKAERYAARGSGNCRRSCGSELASTARGRRIPEEFAVLVN